MGKSSHKDVKDSSSWLFRLYYRNRKFMGYCCVSCEVIVVCTKVCVSSFDMLLNLLVWPTGSLYYTVSSGKEPDRESY